MKFYQVCLAMSALLLVQVDGRCPDFLCMGKGPLGYRLRRIVGINDEDGNGIVTGPELFTTYGNDYDLNGDCCVDKAEWMNRWIYTFKTSRGLAELMWPAEDDTSSCPLSVKFFETSPMKISTASYVDTFINRLREFCGMHRSRYWTNCDCKQLKDTCTFDNVAKKSPACFSLLSCRAQGKLADRLQLNINENDRNGDKLVTGAEFYEDLNQNYDTDGDGCVNLDEWVKRWTSYFKLSAEYATARYVGNESLSCPIEVNSFRMAPISIPLDDFVSDNVQTLVDVCQETPSLLTSNCDCAQLFYTCQFDNYFKTIKACQDVVAKWKEGTFV